MMNKKVYRLWDKGGRIMSTFGARAINIRFPVSDTDRRTSWISMAHGYAVQQSCSVQERDDFYDGLGVLFDQGLRDDLHILTMDINCSIGIDEERSPLSVCGCCGETHRNKAGDFCVLGYLRDLCMRYQPIFLLLRNLAIPHGYIHEADEDIKMTMRL